MQEKFSMIYPERRGDKPPNLTSLRSCGVVAALGYGPEG